jgi:hypothetical protein
MPLLQSFENYEHCWSGFQTVVAILSIHGTAMTPRGDEPLKPSETPLYTHTFRHLLTMSIAHGQTLE